MSVENDVYTIVLNRNWEFTGETKTVKDTMTQFLSYDNHSNWEAIVIDYKEKIDSDTGEVIGYDYEDYTIKTVTRDEWFFQPVYKYSPFIRCAQNKIMRIPTVLIAKNYKEMPKRLERVSKTAIWKRDNYTCQITGKKLDKHNGSIHHVIPKSLGGKDTWENMVLCDLKVNQKIGNKMPDEAGYKLIKTPKAPAPGTFYVSIKHEDWKIFIKH
jgi:hypothetical protein